MQSKVNVIAVYYFFEKKPVIDMNFINDRQLTPF